MRGNRGMGRRGRQGRPWPSEAMGAVRASRRGWARGGPGAGEGSREVTELMAVLGRAAWQLWEGPRQGRRGSRATSPSTCLVHTSSDVSLSRPTEAPSAGAAVLETHRSTLLLRPRPRPRPCRFTPLEEE